MGKCFLGLGFGVLTGLAYFVSGSLNGLDLPRCAAGALEWVYIGGAVTVCALCGYTLYTLGTRLLEYRNRRRS